MKSIVSDPTQQSRPTEQPNMDREMPSNPYIGPRKTQRGFIARTRTFRPRIQPQPDRGQKR